MRLSIRQPLTNDTLQRALSPLAIFNAQLRAVAVAEIKLRNVTVQVLLRAVLVDALHAALEHAVEPLDRVRVRLAPAIFTSAVTDEIMLSEVLAQGSVLPSLVGHDACAGKDVRLDDRHQVSRLRAVHMERPSRAATLHQRQNCVLVGKAALDRGTLFLANIGLVNFDRLAQATKRRQIAGFHGLANAVRHEPRSFVLHIQDAH